MTKRKVLLLSMSAFAGVAVPLTVHGQTFSFGFAQTSLGDAGYYTYNFTPNSGSYASVNAQARAVAPGRNNGSINLTGNWQWTVQQSGYNGGVAPTFSVSDIWFEEDAYTYTNAGAPPGEGSSSSTASADLSVSSASSAPPNGDPDSEGNDDLWNDSGTTSIPMTWNGSVWSVVVPVVTGSNVTCGALASGYGSSSGTAENNADYAAATFTINGVVSDEEVGSL